VGMLQHNVWCVCACGLCGEVCWTAVLHTSPHRTQYGVIIMVMTCFRKKVVLTITLTLVGEFLSLSGKIHDRTRN
jgi:hypothetical protein